MGSGTTLATCQRLSPVARTSSVSVSPTKRLSQATLAPSNRRVTSVLKMLVGEARHEEDSQLAGSVGENVLILGVGGGVHLDTGHPDSGATLGKGADHLELEGPQQPPPEGITESPEPRMVEPPSTCDNPFSSASGAFGKAKAPGVTSPTL